MTVKRALKEIHSVGQQDRNNKYNKCLGTSKATEQKETHVFYWCLFENHGISVVSKHT